MCYRSHNFVLQTSTPHLFLSDTKLAGNNWLWQGKNACFKIQVFLRIHGGISTENEIF